MQGVSNQQIKQDFELVKPWILHPEKKSVVICIPQRMVERYELKKQDRFLLIPKDNGILIQKVDVKPIE